MCFHPRTDMTLPLMKTEEVVTVIKEWSRISAQLGRRFKWVQIFENRGAMMGCSNPHPHCQIWSSDYLPNEAKTKDRTQREFFDKSKGEKVMLIDYLEIGMGSDVDEIYFDASFLFNKHGLVMRVFLF